MDMTNKKRVPGIFVSLSGKSSIERQMKIANALIDTGINEKISVIEVERLLDSLREKEEQEKVG
jgi:hypothetical protein